MCLMQHNQSITINLSLLCQNSSQGICIFLIIISSLTKAAGTVSCSFIWVHHSEFPTVPLLQMQTLCSYFQIPSQFIPAPYESLVFVIFPPKLALWIAVSIFASRLYASLYDWGQKLAVKPVKSLL